MVLYVAPCLSVCVGLCMRVVLNNKLGTVGFVTKPMFPNYCSQRLHIIKFPADDLLLA